MAGLWMSLFIFLGGVILTGIGRIIGRAFERSNTRKLFVSNLQSLRTRIPIEMLRLEKTAKTFNIEEDTNPDHFIPGLIQLEVFRNMTYQNVYKAYFTGIENYFRKEHEHLKIKRFNRAWQIINGLETIVKIINDKQIAWEKENTKYRDEYNQALDDLRRAWAIYLRNYDQIKIVSPRQADFRGRLLGLIADYMAVPGDKAFAVSTTYRMLARSILALCNQNGYGGDAEVDPLIETSLNAINKYKTYEGYVNYNREHYKSFAKAIDDVLPKLHSVVKGLDKKEKNHVLDGSLSEDVNYADTK